MVDKNIFLTKHHAGKAVFLCRIHNGSHMGLGHGILTQDLMRGEAVLTAEGNLGIKGKTGVDVGKHLRGTAGGEKELDSLFSEPVKGVQYRSGTHMGVEADQSAVNIEENSSDHKDTS